jgi:hypothetical protein
LGNPDGSLKQQPTIIVENSATRDMIIGLFNGSGRESEALSDGQDTSH